jgi:hypothetical protein
MYKPFSGIVSPRISDVIKDDPSVCFDAGLLIVSSSNDGKPFVFWGEDIDDMFRSKFNRIPPFCRNDSGVFN